MIIVSRQVFKPKLKSKSQDITSHLNLILKLYLIALSKTKSKF